MLVPRRHVEVERDSRQVVELEQEHRAVDAVVEDGVLIRAADPAQVGLVQAGGDVAHPERGVVRSQPADVGLDQRRGELLLARRERIEP